MFKTKTFWLSCCVLILLTFIYRFLKGTSLLESLFKMKHNLHYDEKYYKTIFVTDGETREALLKGKDQYS
jgi:hypothetical protein